MQVKAGQELKKVLKAAYKAGQPTLLVGRHGIGKSEIFPAAAKELGIESIVLDLSLMEPTDLVGIPQIIDGRTAFAAPAFLPRDGQGIIIFEELNRAPKYMQATTLNLLTSRKLNQYELPKGWVPSAAINPSSEGYEVAELDKALLSRFSVLEVVPDRDEWLAWAEENGVHRKVIEFVRRTPAVFNIDDDWSNPRAWAYVSNHVKAYESGGGDLHVLLILLAGHLGDTWATSFIRFYKDRSDAPLLAIDIIKGFHTHKSLTVTWQKAKRTDLFESSWHNLKNHLQKQEHFDAITEDRLCRKNVTDFLKTLPADIHENACGWMEDKGYEL